MNAARCAITFELLRVAIIGLGAAKIRIYIAAHFVVHKIVVRLTIQLVGSAHSVIKISECLAEALLIQRILLTRTHERIAILVDVMI